MIKKVRSEIYNYNFNPSNGLFNRWGRIKEEDPNISPFGPEIADIEISTICHGLGTPCSFCYKSNTPNGKVMTLDDFKLIFHNLPKNLTQIAFGIGDINANPDMLDIFWYTRDHGVIPNVTINGYGLSKEMAFKLAEVCGAVAVSRYTPKNVCYGAVKMLTDEGLEQVNIHQLVSEETWENCWNTIVDMKNDARLEKLNAIVFLSLKKKGRGNGFNPISQEAFSLLVDIARHGNVRFGFDSCSCHKFLKSIEGYEDFKKYDQLAEPCESTLFSIYINVDGEVYPCSFTEEGTPLGNVKTESMMDIWNKANTVEFRNKLLTNGRRCPIYEV